MRKRPFALALLLPLAGCAHQGAYGGGGGGYFAGDCLYSYGCYDGAYRPGYFSLYGYTVQPQPARAQITKVERRTSTRVVRRSAVATGASRSTPVRSSSHASAARSAPAAASHSGGHR